jgi:hypothetical protein
VSTEVNYPQIGVCGLSCRLCPRYNTSAASRCEGCKTESRRAAGCPFITCAVKQRGLEFCWQCDDHASCEKWRGHREYGKHYDSFVSYGALEADLAAVQQHGIAAFDEAEQAKARLLTDLLRDFDDGRSKSYYCTAATLLSLADLRAALDRAQQQGLVGDMRESAKLMHSLLDKIATSRGVSLGLRKRR